MLTALSSFFTFTGTREPPLLFVPFPSCPAMLSPQHSTCPVPRSAHDDPFPLAMATAPDRPFTRTGVSDRSTLVPFPNAPYWLPPQRQRALPSFSAAHDQFEPVDTATTFVTPFTVTGETEFAVVPFPSAPSVPLPQHWTVPLLRAMHVWDCIEMATALVTPFTNVGFVG